jgi:hypothetical protein
MTLKLVTRSAQLSALLLLVIACVFALVTAYTPMLSGVPVDPEQPSPALARGISVVPHSVTAERFVNCETCHAIGARRAMPTNHRTFMNQDCSLCHAYPPPEQVALPSSEIREVRARLTGL